MKQMKRWWFIRFRFEGKLEGMRFTSFEQKDDGRIEERKEEEYHHNELEKMQGITIEMKIENDDD